MSATNCFKTGNTLIGDHFQRPTNLRLSICGVCDDGAGEGATKDTGRVQRETKEEEM